EVRLRLRALVLRALGEDQRWRFALLDDFLVDDALLHALQRRKVVHHVEHDLFEDRAQTARAGLARLRLDGDRDQRFLREGQLDAVHPHDLLELTDERVARLDEDAAQGQLVERVEGDDDRQTADELRDQPEAQQILRHQLLQHLRVQPILLRLGVGTEAERVRGDAALDDLFEAVERAAADEQHVGGVDLDELLVRVLAPALGRNVGRRALEDLEQRLLDALAADVAGDRRVLALARDLVDLVDVDDALLGALDVVVGGLDELEQDVLDVLTDVAGLGEAGRVGHRERNVENLRQRLREVGLAAAGGADEQDVALLQLD